MQLHAAIQRRVVDLYARRFEYAERNVSLEKVFGYGFFFRYEVPGMGHRNHGALDYKGTNYELFQKLRLDVVGGPPYDPLPPFK